VTPIEILALPFVLIISVPGGAFLPAGALAIWVGRRWSSLGGLRRGIAGGSVIVWIAYAAYETWMYFWMQSVVAPIRVDLLVIVPLLLVATLAALIACFGRGRQW